MKNIIKFHKNSSYEARKSLLLMLGIIMPYHPNRKKDRDLCLKLSKKRSYSRNDLPECIREPEAFNCSGLLQQTVLFLNTDLKDNVSAGNNSDHVCKKTGKYSDVKSSSFSQNAPRRSPNVHRGTISGVRSPAGVLKNGALRVVISDPFRMINNFYYLPKKVWHTWKITGKKNRQGAIPYSYNSKTGIISKLEPYRVSTPKEWANRND